jgi:hypothetical protein
MVRGCIGGQFDQRHACFWLAYQLLLVNTASCAAVLLAPRQPSSHGSSFTLHCAYCATSLHLEEHRLLNTW